MIVQHILTGFIVLGVPLINIYGIKKLKVKQTTSSKIKMYLNTMLVLWIMVGFIWSMSSTETILHFNYNIEINLMITILFAMFLFYTIVTTLAPLLLLRHEKFRHDMLTSFKERSFILPETKLEVSLFVLVAISVGICEEIIFRSYLVNYLVDVPFGLSLTSCFVIAGLIFGIGHFHQGMNGMINAAIFGFVMSYLFIVTGNLLLPIIIHIVYDLKILFLTRINATIKVNR